MLKQFSRLEKTRSLLILFFVVILLLGLLVAGAVNRAPSTVANPLRNRDVLAKVNGDSVKVAELAARKKFYEQRLGGQFSLAQMGMTDERVLDGLINDRIAAQEAARLHLTPSTEEVRDVIRKQFTDATGNFDLARYKEYVNRNFGGIELYEAQISDGIAIQKLRAFVTAGVQVSDLDVQKDWERKNTKYDLAYVPVTAADLAKNVNPSEEELHKYYDEHQTDFRVLEPQKKIQYLYISQEKVGDKINIPDEDLRKEFDQLKPENKEAGVKVQQIVLNVASPQLDQTVLQKATELVGRVRGEDLKADENAFAELARGNSQDVATAKAGGFLPAPVKKNPNRPKNPKVNNPAELLQNVFDLQQGQVSDPMKTGNAYYIFRRGDSIPKTFEDAKKELLVSLHNRRGYAAAAQLAARAVERLKATKDFPAVAKELAGEANMNAAEMVKTTPFVKPGDTIPDIGSSPQFEQAIEPLTEPGQIGDRVSIKGGFAIPSLVSQKEPNVIPEFDEIKDKIVEGVRTDHAKSQLEQTARDIANDAGNADALKAAAEKHGLKAETAEAYKLGSPLGTVGTDPAADNAIAALKSGEIDKTPVKIGESWVVLAMTKRTDADLAEFGKQRDQLVESELMTRRSEIYDDYIASVRAPLEKSNDIKIYSDVLERLADAEEPPVAAPARAPRSPIQIPAK